MTETVQVEAARIPDRDRLLEELREAGLDARAVDEVGIEVPLDADADEAADEVIAHAERRDHAHRRALRADQARGHDLHPPAAELGAGTNGHRVQGFLPCAGAPSFDSAATTAPAAALWRRSADIAYTSAVSQRDNPGTVPARRGARREGSERASYIRPPLS